MGLYMPTNITPDRLGPFGNGVVEADDTALPGEAIIVILNEIPVSWQVNGNVPMTAFRIKVYDSSGVLQVDTGMRTDDCPFYGKNAKGEIQRFSYTVETARELSTSETYYMYITQYWNTDFSGSIQQVSPSVFVARYPLSITISNPGTVVERKYNFTAQYPAIYGTEEISWIQWILERNLGYGSSEEEWKTIEQTDKLYGVGIYEYEYDGFSSHGQYRLTCRAGTQHGVQKSDTIKFISSYSASTFEEGELSATSPCNTSAIELDINGVAVIHGEGSGDCSIESNTLILGTGASVLWDKVNGTAMSMAALWSIVFKGQLVRADAELLTVTTESGTIELSYDHSAGTVTIGGTAISIPIVKSVSSEDVILFALTPSEYYLTVITVGGGLYPLTTLYPGTTLYPQPSVSGAVVAYNGAVTYTQSAITEIKTEGKCEVSYIQEISGTLSSTVISEIAAGTYVPAHDNSSNFLADFRNGLEAGTVYINNAEIIGWEFYREGQTSGDIQRLCDTELPIKSIYDYGVGSNLETYKYYMYAVGEAKILSNAVVSNEVADCFWDWVLLECEDSGDGYYEVVNEYMFGCNVDSGSISNNNSPTIEENFTRYPTVMRACQQYRSGTLTALAGNVSSENGAAPDYEDSRERLESIAALSLTDNTLFLKNRKGDVIMIAISGPISYSTMDETEKQAATVSIPWIEIGSVDGISLVKIEYM